MSPASLFPKHLSVAQPVQVQLIWCQHACSLKGTSVYVLCVWNQPCRQLFMWSILLLLLGSHSPTGRIEENTTCSPVHFNVFLRDIHSPFRYFRVCSLQPLLTLQERAGIGSSTLALPGLVVSLWHHKCRPQQAANLSREFVWITNRCFSASHWGICNC